MNNKWERNTAYRFLLFYIDFYYSIKKLLWHWDISVDVFYNDVFSSSKKRNWWIMDNYYAIFDWDIYNNMDIISEQSNRDIYNYYLTVKKLWRKDWIFNNLETLR